MSTLEKLVDALIKSAEIYAVGLALLNPSIHKERVKRDELRAAILEYDRDLDDTVPAGSVMVAREVWDTVMADLIYGKRFSPARIQAIRQAVEGFPPSTGHAPGSG